MGSWTSESKESGGIREAIARDFGRLDSADALISEAQGEAGRLEHADAEDIEAAVLALREAVSGAKASLLADSEDAAEGRYS